MGELRVDHGAAACTALAQVLSCPCASSWRPPPLVHKASYLGKLHTDLHIVSVPVLPAVMIRLQAIVVAGSLLYDADCSESARERHTHTHTRRFMSNLASASRRGMCFFSVAPDELALSKASFRDFSCSRESNWSEEVSAKTLSAEAKGGS
eukprot:2484248-Amphidinium_carterae.1